MALRLRMCALLMCVGALLPAQARVDNPAQTPARQVSDGLEEREFGHAQATSDQWLRDYDSHKISGDQFVALMNQFISEKSIRFDVADAEDWVKHHPRSYAANFVLGTYVQMMFAREGGKPSDNYGSRDERQQQFTAALTLAEHYLLASTALAKSPYPSYCRLIAIASGLKSERRLVYFKKAIAIDAGALEAHARLLRALAPKNGGSAAEMHAAYAESTPMLKDAGVRRQLEALKYELLGEDAIDKDTAAAIALYSRAYRTAPTPENLWRLETAAEIARSKEYVPLALELHGEILAIDPDKHDKRYMRGSIYEHRTKQLDLATADYILAANGGNVHAQIALGDIYMQGKKAPVNFALAEKYLNMAAATKWSHAIAKRKELDQHKLRAAAQAAGLPAPPAAIPLFAPARGPAWTQLLEVHEFGLLEETVNPKLQAFTSKQIGGDALADALNVLDPSGGFDVRWVDAAAAWTKRYPRSYAASYVHGVLLVALADKQRGGAFRDQTPVQQLAASDALNQQAEQELVRSLTLMAKPYPSYMRLIRLSHVSSAKYYRLAIAADPQGFQAHSMRLRALAPKWGGSLAALDATIRSAVAGKLSAENKARVHALGDEIKGDDANLRGDFQNAITLYRSAYLKAPGTTRLWRLQRAADIAYENGRFTRALALYLEVISADPSVSTVRRDALSKAGALLMRGPEVPQDLDRAEQLLTQAAALEAHTAPDDLAELGKRRRNEGPENVPFVPHINVQSTNATGSKVPEVQ